MFKKIKDKKNIIFLLINLISIIVFVVVSFIDWSLVTGFILGSIVSILSYLLNKFYVSKLLSKRRTFKSSFFISIIKSIILFILMGGVLIGILFANNLNYNSWISGMFNVFTFLYGYSTIMISIIVNYLFFGKNTSKNKIKIKKEGA